MPKIKKTTEIVDLPPKFKKDNPVEKRLYINKKYYICVGDKYNFIFKEVNNKKNRVGNKYPDTCIAFAGDLNSMFRIITHRFCNEVIGDDITQIRTILEKLYILIDERIPTNVKPKDIFDEVDIDG